MHQTTFARNSAAGRERRGPSRQRRFRGRIRSALAGPCFHRKTCAPSATIRRQPSVIPGRTQLTSMLAGLVGSSNAAPVARRAARDALRGGLGLRVDQNSGASCKYSAGSLSSPTLPLLATAAGHARGPRRPARPNRRASLVASTRGLSLLLARARPRCLMTRLVRAASLRQR